MRPGRILNGNNGTNCLCMSLGPARVSPSLIGMRLMGDRNRPTGNFRLNSVRGASGMLAFNAGTTSISTGNFCRIPIVTSSPRGSNIRFSGNTLTTTTGGMLGRLEGPGRGSLSLDGVTSTLCGGVPMLATCNIGTRCCLCGPSARGLRLRGAVGRTIDSCSVTTITIGPISFGFLGSGTALSGLSS